MQTEAHSITHIAIDTVSELCLNPANMKLVENPPATVTSAAQECQDAAQQTLISIYDVLAHPGLRHLPPHTEQNPYPALRKYLGHAPDPSEYGIILSDEHADPANYANGMRTFVSAIGMTAGSEPRLEHPSSLARTIIWVSGHGDHNNNAINALRVNPYRIIAEQAYSLTKLSLYRQSDGIVQLLFHRSAHVIGESFIPFDIQDSHRKIARWNSARPLDAIVSLDDLTRNQHTQGIQELTRICKGVTEYLSLSIAQNMRRGWDHLPSTGTY